MRKGRLRVRHCLKRYAGLGNDLHPVRPGDPLLLFDPIGKEQTAASLVFLALPANPELSPRRELDSLRLVGSMIDPHPQARLRQVLRSSLPLQPRRQPKSSLV